MRFIDMISILRVTEQIDKYALNLNRCIFIHIYKYNRRTSLFFVFNFSDNIYKHNKIAFKCARHHVGKVIVCDTRDVICMQI